MAIWKNEADKDATASPSRAPAVKPADVHVPAAAAERPPSAVPRPGATTASGAESILAAGLIIEGKIQGTGHVRIAGQFSGDIHVDGNLSIEPGAKVTGSVMAKRVIVAGELQGNIDAAAAVELAATGVLNGDLKAGSLTVAAGSRMRGKVEFGWDERDRSASSQSSQTYVNRTGSGSTA